MKNTESGKTGTGKKICRLLFVACAVYGGMKVLGGIFVNFIYLVLRTNAGTGSAEAATVGIIGGADGPTAIFVTMPPWYSWIVPLILLLAGIWGILRLRKSKKKS